MGLLTASWAGHTWEITDKEQRTLSELAFGADAAQITDDAGSINYVDRQLKQISCVQNVARTMGSADILQIYREWENDIGTSATFLLGGRSIADDMILTSVQMQDTDITATGTIDSARIYLVFTQRFFSERQGYRAISPVETVNTTQLDATAAEKRAHSKTYGW